MTTNHAPLEETPTLEGTVELHSAHNSLHPAHAKISGRLRRRLVISLLVFFGLGGAIAGAGMLTGFLPNPVVAGDPKVTGLVEPTDQPHQTVKVVHPKREPNYHMTTVLPVAKVEPFYQAGLRSRVSGEVLSVAKDIGESVKAGELLVEIDVPDLKQAVEQKQAIISQREKELAAAMADQTVAEKAVAAAAVAVKVKGLDVKRAQNVVKARKFDLDADTTLYDKGVILKDKLLAAQLDYSAAEVAIEAAQVDVQKAKVDEEEKIASLGKAKVDVELKASLVEVARKDRDAAAIQYSYSRLYAPFDGVIVARSTDPGKFVFGGPTGASEPLITVGRIDLVTVAAKVPDNYAPFVSYNTEALVEFAQLPGVSVRGLITRYSHVVDPTDQSMRVEVDVYNGSQADYRAMLSRAAVRSTISAILPFDRAANILAVGTGLIRSKADHKGWHEGAALTPDWGPGGRYHQIVSGTTATMRLDLEKFTDTFLLPSSAVYTRAGQPYILVIENGVTRQIPVAVPVNDGKLAKVAAVTPTASGQQVTRELTGNEVVVVARQLEIGEGQSVTPVFEK